MICAKMFISINLISGYSLLNRQNYHAVNLDPDLSTYLQNQKSSLAITEPILISKFRVAKHTHYNLKCWVYMADKKQLIFLAGYRWDPL
jgi:hypothetical protein